MKVMICAILIFLNGCSDLGQLTFVTDLPYELEENSGIAYSNEENVCWFVNDSGNKDHLYGVNFQGELLHDFNIKHAANEDWEDLTQDEQGNLYIGDFGNNSGKRKKLDIYKIHNPSKAITDEIKAERIRFEFPENNGGHNIEAFFYFKNENEERLFLFTKNRNSKSNVGHTLVYSVPAQAGEYTATFIRKINLCDDPRECPITSAAISPDKNRVVLLSHDRLYVLSNFLATKFSGDFETIELGHDSQKEAVCFKDQHSLLISDEEAPHGGRNLYEYNLPVKN